MLPGSIRGLRVACRWPLGCFHFLHTNKDPEALSLTTRIILIIKRRTLSLSPFQFSPLDPVLDVSDDRRGPRLPLALPRVLDVPVDDLPTLETTRRYVETPRSEMPRRAALIHNDRGKSGGCGGVGSSVHNRVRKLIPSIRLRSRTFRSIPIRAEGRAPS